MVAEMSVA